MWRPSGENILTFSKSIFDYDKLPVLLYKWYNQEVVSSRTYVCLVKRIVDRLLCLYMVQLQQDVVWIYNVKVSNYHPKRHRDEMKLKILDHVYFVNNWCLLDLKRKTNMLIVISKWVYTLLSGGVHFLKSRLFLHGLYIFIVKLLF